MKRCEFGRGVHFTGSLSYRCLYLTEVSTLQGMSIIQRCAPGRGVCQTNKSCREKRCTSKRCVRMTEMSTFQGCEPGRGVPFTGVSVIRMSIPVRSVHLAGDVYHTEVSVNQTNLVGVSVKEVFAWQRYSPSCVVYYIELYTWQECPPLKGFYHTDTLYLHLAKVLTLRGCLPYRFGGVYQTELYIWQESPFLKGGWNTVVHLTGCEPFRGVISVMCTWLQGCLSYRGLPLGGVNVEGMSTLQECLTNLMPESTWEGCSPYRLGYPPH